MDYETKINIFEKEEVGVATETMVTVVFCEYIRVSQFGPSYTSSACTIFVRMYSYCTVCTIVEITESRVFHASRVCCGRILQKLFFEKFS